MPVSAKRFGFWVGDLGGERSVDVRFCAARCFRRSTAASSPALPCEEVIFSRNWCRLRLKFVLVCILKLEWAAGGRQGAGGSLEAELKYIALRLLRQLELNRAARHHRT